MSVERMKLLNLVGPIEHCDDIFRRLVLTELVHPINAVKEIEGHRFHSDEALEYDEEMKSYLFDKYPGATPSFKGTSDRLMKLLQLLKIDPIVDVAYLEKGKFNPHLADNIQLLFERFEGMNHKIEMLSEEYQLLMDSKIIESFDDVSVPLHKLFNLERFSTHFGTLSHEYRNKIDFNYENIPAIVLHLGNYQNEEVYLIIAPLNLEEDTERILRSVHFKEMPLAMAYLDYPQVMLRKLNLRMIEIANELTVLKGELESFKDKFERPLIEAYSDLSIERGINELRQLAAFTKHFFYFAGWIPQSGESTIADRLNRYQAEVLYFYREKDEVDDRFTPPTRLKNTWFTKPFETMVKMYGTPNYSEIDPTAIFGWTYMLLFGAMFGDLGQGMTFVLAGFLFMRKEGMRLYGQLMVRLGLSSALFGLWYDSIFGYEHVISRVLFGKVAAEEGAGLFLRPIDNIDMVLTLSIGLGVLLLLISYGISVANKLKIKDYQEGLFGRNGVAGLVLYMSVLVIVLDRFQIFKTPLISLLVAISALCVLIIVFKEPLINALTHHRPYFHEKASEYFIESGFDVIETFLSMLSNSVSFIRVGAFALNHVGLFIAFHTIGEMIGTTTASVITVIVGNIIVIGLEGLIVFIQGLRLMYYEMFSKYYQGDGLDYAPIKVA